MSVDGEPLRLPMAETARVKPTSDCGDGDTGRWRRVEGGRRGLGVGPSII